MHALRIRGQGHAIRATSITAYHADSQREPLQPRTEQQHKSSSLFVIYDYDKGPCNLYPFMIMVP